MIFSGYWALQFFWSAIRTQIHKKISECNPHSIPQLFLECGLLHSNQHSTPQVGLECCTPLHTPIHRPLRTPIQFSPRKYAGLVPGLAILEGATWSVECGLECQSGLRIGVLECKVCTPAGTPPCGVQYCGVPFCTPPQLALRTPTVGVPFQSALQNDPEFWSAHSAEWHSSKACRI